MALFALIPLLQVFLNTMRTDRQVKTMPIGLPEQFSLVNYADTWRIGEYGVAYVNTILVAAVVIVIVLTVVGLGAYALSKLEFRLKGFMTAYFFCSDFSSVFSVYCPGLFYFEQSRFDRYQSESDDRLYGDADPV